MRIPVLAVCAAFIAFGSLLLGAAPAAAGANRVWVSGHGTDQAGCGAPTAPCRSLQYAHDTAVNAGGEIDILDPAGYGAVRITKPVSIVNEGVGTAGLQTNGAASAVDIQVGAGDTVFLKGLDLGGDWACCGQSGLHGINFVGGRLVVDNCVARRFYEAVLIGSDGGQTLVEIVDSLLSDNEGAGVVIHAYSGGVVTALLDHVAVVNNADSIDAANLGSARLLLTVSNSDISGNQDGIVVNGELSTPGSLLAEIDNSTLSQNAGSGLETDNSATAHLARSVIDQNGGYGISNGTFAAVYSAGDNHIEENALGASTGKPIAPDIWR